LTIRSRLRRILGKTGERVVVRDGAESYAFFCENSLEQWRARTLLTKEAGTVDWIKTHVKPGQVFLDVGANIGLYTVLAATRVGRSGMVYAVEPHLGNAFRLMQNVRANAIDAQVKVISVALHDSNGFVDFNYNAEIAGSSMSQLGSRKDSEEREFDAVLREYKCAVTVDSLIASGAMRAPQHIKIDVDGNELMVLNGMRTLLFDAARPLTIQVEINRRYREDVMQLMREAGYGSGLRHDTKAGLEKIKSGKDPEDVAHNLVFLAAPR
jgi:FkbM family methyltransferase